MCIGFRVVILKRHFRISLRGCHFLRHGKLLMLPRTVFKKHSSSSSARNSTDFFSLVDTF